MTLLCVEDYEIPAANMGEDDPLPYFRDLEQDDKVGFDENLPDEDREFKGWRTRFRVLPYRMQNGYDRARTQRKFKALVLENEFLRAVFLPELGGRLVSLFRKDLKREIIARNPVFQPANLALRNAWISGGIEWNTAQPGHHYLTCAPVHAVRVTGSDGTPFLRMYEYERTKCFPWQIDFHLPSDSSLLFAHIRILNPHEYEIPMYWWTNIAIPETDGGRVVYPADTAIRPGKTGALEIMYMPHADGRDVTYATNLPQAQEFFTRIPDGQRRWMAHVEPDGKGFFQTSTERLRGRKMFCWGMNQGGRRWQEFLAEPGFAYLEIQAGLARTQHECIPMPANTLWDWTEAFGMLEVNPENVHTDDWDCAQRTVDERIETLLPDVGMQRLHGEYSSDATRKPDESLFYGSGWGELEQARGQGKGYVNHEFLEGLTWPHIEDKTLSPWRTLLATGEFPEQDPDEAVASFMIQDEWRLLLERAVSGKSALNWAAWFHLGVMRLENLDEAGARMAWEESLKLRRTGWALRNLAILEGRAANRDKVRGLLKEAWDAGPKHTALAVEYAHALAQDTLFDEMDSFLQSLPQEIRDHERIAILKAKGALHAGRLEEVAPVFQRSFATIREGEVTLTDLWFEYHERRIVRDEGAVRNDALTKRVRKEFPPPKAIDFRMIAEVG